LIQSENGIYIGKTVPTIQTTFKFVYVLFCINILRTNIGKLLNRYSNSTKCKLSNGINIFEIRRIMGIYKC